MKTKKMTTLSIRNSISRPPLRRGLPGKQQLPRTQPMWIIRGFFLIPLAIALAWFALSPAAQAVTPAPDGGYPGGNTAEGDDALFSLTSGTNNTAIGFDALYSSTAGTDNTAMGFNALHDNRTGSNNTANGSNALLRNTADNNTATGDAALANNTTGTFNTANGVDALVDNMTGSSNTANGASALVYNTNGNNNTANGYLALYYNKGSNNTATGASALAFNNASNNTAIGFDALSQNRRGSNNIALGSGAGFNLTTGSNNIDIGNSGGTALETNTIRIGTTGTQTNTYIAGISGVTVAGGVGVIIDADGHLGTVVSSARFKDEIKPMDKASEAILALKPVTFRYKHELDPDGIPQFGLVAEQVEKVNPDLVVRDEQGKPYTVRYEAVNAMLLNEFLKEHRKVEELEVTAAKQQKQIEALTAGLQTVSAQVEMSKPAPQMVLNNQ
jgi:hypothetical protein